MDYAQLGILFTGLICMGAALGFERSLLPRMAVDVWHVTGSTSTVLNLVSTFGASKAVANVLAGPFADHWGRKPTLIMGFIIGLPVMPYVLIATLWSRVTAMNVMFGFSQGCIGSALFFLLIDVMGPQRRGIAVGLGEGTIYVTTALVNVLAGDLASRYGYRPVPFLVATAFAVMGLLSTIPLKDTLAQVQAEQNQKLSKIVDENTQDFVEEHLEMDPEKVIENSDPKITARTGKTAKQKVGYIADAWREDETISWGSSDEIQHLHKKLPLDVRQRSAKALATAAAAEEEEEDKEILTQDHTYMDINLHPVLSQQDLSEHVYNSTNGDFDEDEDDDDDDDDSEYHRLEEWDQAVRTSVVQISNTLQKIGRIPASVLQCTEFNQPDDRYAYFQQQSISQEEHAKVVTEGTPLVVTAMPLEEYTGYDAMEDSSDQESEDAVTPTHWDQVEREVKTMYPSAFHILAHMLWSNPNYSILCLAGMTMNFKDGFAWGSFPLFFSKFHHLSDDHTDMLVAVYPLCWGFGQAFTGALSDIYGRRLFLLWGFGACTIGMVLFFVPGFLWGRPANDNPRHIFVWILADTGLGVGTAMAYPALQAAVADEMLPVHRGLGLGFYRFTRDMGYVVGAVVCGDLTDKLGYPATFLIVASVLGATFLCIFFFFHN